MTKNYENLIACVKQQVNFYDRLSKNRRRNITRAEVRKQMFWELAGIHQSALFVLSTDEYYKFKEQATEIEGGYYSLPDDDFEKQEINESQMTLF